MRGPTQTQAQTQAHFGSDLHGISEKTTAAEAGTRDRARRSVAASTVGNGGTLFQEDWLARARSPSHPGHAHWERWLSRAAELGFIGAVDESDAVQGKWYTYDPIAAKL